MIYRFLSLCTGMACKKAKETSVIGYTNFTAKKQEQPTPAFCIYFARYVFYSEYINLHEAS